MAPQLRKAERRQAKMRVGVTAPSGGGKTYSALLMARGLARDWEHVALIDTENGSGELYAHLGAYNALTLEPPFTPERYIEAIVACEKAGMDVIVLDSVTHEWDGPGGCLEIKDSLGGKYQDWAKVTPRHQKFLTAILQADCHVVTTTRRKQDYEMTKSPDGKVMVEKVGLKEVQRDGFEYELTLNLELDIRHNAVASKDRTGLFMDKPAFVISEATGATLKAWCETGAPATVKPAAVVPAAKVDLIPQPLTQPGQTDATALASIASPGNPYALPFVASGAPISEAQRRRLYAITKKHGWGTDAVSAHLALFGYEHSADILTAHYDVIVRFFDLACEGMVA